MDNILSTIGLAKRAGAIEAGDEPVGAAARAREAFVIFVASDAADNTYRRVRHFAGAGDCPWLSLPFTKDDLGTAVGRTSCAMVAITDAGFADSIVKKLAAAYGEKYAEVSAELDVKAEGIVRRKRERLAHEKNIKTGADHGRRKKR